MSAGTVGTPHILLNSGIGDSQELSAIGIEPLLHLPSVGKGLVDHPRLLSNWFVNGTDTYDDINRNATLLDMLLEKWNATQKGPLVDTFAGHLFFARVPGNSTIFREVVDPAAGPNAAHFELAFSVRKVHIVNDSPSRIRLG